MQLKRNIAISDSGFLFNPSTGDSYSINTIGNQILRLMKEDKDENQIIEYMLENYDIDIDAVKKDLYDFKKMLESYRLIQS